MCLGRDLSKSVSLSDVFFSKILYVTSRLNARFRSPLQFRTWLNASSNAAARAPGNGQFERSEGISRAHSSCKHRVVKPFFPTYCQKLEKSCSKGTRPQLPRHEALKFLVLLAGEVVLLQLLLYVPRIVLRSPG